MWSFSHTANGYPLYINICIKSRALDLGFRLGNMTDFCVLRWFYLVLHTESRIQMLYPSATSALRCFCGNNYSSPQDLEEYRRARGHFLSHRCTTLCKHPVFAPKNGPAQVCGECGKTCKNSDIFRDHAVATGHCFCYDCDLTFPSRKSWEGHREPAKHASEFRCCDCNISFQDFHALVAHMESRAHRKPL